MTGDQNRGLLYALLAAVSASLVGVFGKIGMDKIDPIFATAVRSVIMMMFCVIVAFAMGFGSKVPTLPAKAVVMLILSGLAGATSWIFGFTAIHLIGVAKTAPIDKLSVPLAVVLAYLFLGERPTWYNWSGVILIAGGAYLAALR